MGVSEVRSAIELDDDARRLAELGYKQELHRRLSGFSNFAISFSIISILAGAITSYGIAMVSGGPIAISIGWPLVGVFVLLVGMGMAEICSAYPTAGGLYFWAARLARKNKRQWAWFTGWYNFLGEFAVTAAIDYGCATTWLAFFNLTTGLEVTQTRTYITFLIILTLHGLLNTFGVDLVRLLLNVSAWWHVFGAAIIAAVLAFVPKHHQSLSWTFTAFKNYSGWGVPIYVFLIGLLMAQYTYTGFDASAHVSEETRNAARAAAKGIIHSIWVSILGGWVLLVATTAAIQNYEAEMKTATGLPPAQIYIDAVGQNTGVFLLFIAAMAQFFCGMASVTANSRMAFAFSRDNALPFSRVWSKVNPRTGTPTNSIWLCWACSAILAAPALFSTTAYLACTSIAVIGLYIGYVTPVLLRRLNPNFEPGPWNLGRWSPLVGWLAVIWVAFIIILFMLPPTKPITVNSFNYAPIAVAIVALFSWVTWRLKGRHYFMRGRSEHLTKSEEEILGEEA
ncbi:amino acid permease [Acidothermus cellulolyticus]|uniref:amino acid permease n=1 Tax=Acidothermus cellulolyticus TaxID=28049 RepID=UPI0005A16C18